MRAGTTPQAGGQTAAYGQRGAVCCAVQVYLAHPVVAVPSRVNDTDKEGPREKANAHLAQVMKRLQASKCRGIWRCVGLCWRPG